VKQYYRINYLDGPYYNAEQIICTVMTKTAYPDILLCYIFWNVTGSKFCLGQFSSSWKSCL